MEDKETRLCFLNSKNSQFIIHTCHLSLPLWNAGRNVRLFMTSYT